MADGKAFVKTLNNIWGSAGSAFILDDKGEKIIANNQENIRRAVAKLEVTLSHDEFSHRDLITRGDAKPVVFDDEWLNWLHLEVDARFHFSPSIERFTQVVSAAAKRNKTHPVKEYLAALRWDGVSRLDEWLIRLARAADTPYVRAVSSLVLIAAVRRVRDPGCKFDEALILESPQGYEKSAAIQALCPKMDWFLDDLPLNVDAKVVIERTAGKWIVEAAELSGMSKANVEHLKRFMSAQVDGPVRMAYARIPVQRDRQFIIIGTTNMHAYLKDTTGGRRFWPVRVDRFNIAMLLKIRDQLWAEAAFRESRGDPIRLDRSLWDHAALQQERRRAEDPWEEVIVHKLPRDLTLRLNREQVWGWLGIPPAARDEQSLTRLQNVMQRLGFDKRVVKVGKTTQRGWGRDLSGEQQSLIDESRARDVEEKD
jgi:predicted P-loop ATPase